MKQVIFLTVLFLGSIFNVHAQSKTFRENCTGGSNINGNYSRAGALQSIMQRYTKEGMPGVSIAIYTEKEGWWAGAGGYSNVEKKLPMEICQLQYTQSVSKTYMAVAIMKLHEEGKIAFDVPVSRYLPAKYCKYIRGVEKITVRMLLNHTSGVAEYSTDPGLASQIIQHPLEYFSAEDCLRSISKEELGSTPGTKYEYRNTNYLLLSLIGDAITGDHAAYIKKVIFKPLGLSNSYYGNDHAYLRGLPLTDSYWDILGVGRPANVSMLQQVNVASLKGDDGIVCTPLDAVKFIKGLMEGKILSEASMKEMLTFVKDEKGNPKYGMGIFYFDLGGLVAYGHGGGGLGAGCALMYVPSQKTYLFLATNLNVLMEGPLSKKCDEMKTELLGTILQ
jgi:D-alanyl-D-alanine carboxypeptidase